CVGVTALFFFFQAEDGIRDFHVTGVQTCALPISSRQRKPGLFEVISYRINQGTIRVSAAGMNNHTNRFVDHENMIIFKNNIQRRSEERRVGKEGRTRWSAEH